MFCRFLSLIIMASLVSLVLSCGRVSETKKTLSVPDEVEQVILQALEKALVEKRYQDSRAVFFAEILSTRLRFGHPQAAQARFLKAAEKDIPLAASAAGIIESYYFDRKQYDKLKLWCATESGIKFDVPALASIADWHFKAVCAMGNFDGLPSLLSQYLDRFPADRARSMANQWIMSLLSKQRYQAASNLMDVIESKYGDVPEWRGLASGLRLKVFIMREMWKEADKYFRQIAGSVPENSLVAMLRELYNAQMRAGQVKLADRLCSFVLEKMKGAAKAQETAANLWLRMANKQSSVKLVLKRLAALKGYGVEPEAILRITSIYNMLVIGDPNRSKTDVVALLTHYETLLPALDQDKDREFLLGMMLDACYCADQYEKALQLLENGIPGRSLEWQIAMAAKVRAHIGLRDGKKRQVVDDLRTFMGYVATQFEEISDPVTGDRITREMILGLNAARIGDILTALNDTEGALKAYAEASGYYQKALSSLNQSSDEYKRVSAELQKLGWSQK